MSVCTKLFFCFTRTLLRYQWHFVNLVAVNLEVCNAICWMFSVFSFVMGLPNSYLVVFIF